MAIKRNGLTTADQNTIDLGGAVRIDPVAHYLRVRELEQLLNQVLDTALQRQVSIANYEGGRLVVFCRDAASASHLRYQAQDYMRQLRNYAEFQDLTTLRVRVG